MKKMMAMVVGEDKGQEDNIVLKFHNLVLFKIY
jgi:hypothetical protein